MNIKIQCGCGAKYSLEIEREQMEAGVSLLCQDCGADISEALTRVLQEQVEHTALWEGAPVAERALVSAAAEGAAPGARVVMGFDAPRVRPCLKHPDSVVVAECVVCGKALCPKCLEHFGYVCSAYCKGKAQESGTIVPEYAGQRIVVERNFWRRARLGALAIGAVVALFLGAYAWYAFIGSHPRVVWSEKMPRTSAGWCQIVGPGELLVWHGNTLARYDLNKHRKVWSATIGGDESAAVGDLSEESNRSRRVQWSGGSVWALVGEELVQFEWATGNRLLSVPVPGRVERYEASAQVLFLVMRDDLGRQTVTRVDSPTGKVRSERLPFPDADNSVTRPTVNSLVTASSTTIVPFESELVPAGENVVLFSVKLLETRIKSQQTTAQPKGKSVLESGVTGANADEAIAEILSERQRDETDGMRYEDESRYAVTLRRLLGESTSDWVGEVIGPPTLYALATVDVLVAGKTVQVFYKANKKLWQSSLTSPIPNSSTLQHDPFVESEQVIPVAEHGSRLYLFDSTILSCFDLATGNALWRFQAGGISGLQFDREGMVYVTSTRGGLEHLRDADRLDPERGAQPAILKLDPTNGSPLWDLPRRVSACRASGKFLYGMDASKGDSGTLTRRPIPEHMRLHRLDNDTGLVRWEYYQKRMPLSWDCHDNTIVLLFRNELQVLRFLSF